MQVGADGGAYALDLVCGYGHTDSGSADKNSPVAFSVGDGMSHLDGNFGIINLVKLGDTEILNRKTALDKVVFNFVLEFKSAVVTANGNFHTIISFQK